MSLAFVVEFMREDFLACECPAPILFGRTHLKEHAAPVRVVVIPSEKPDRYEPPLAIQARGSMPQTVANWQPGQNPRTVATRVVFGEAHVWGAAPIQSDPTMQKAADQAVLDALVNQVFCSLRRAGPGNNRFLSGRQIPDANVRRGMAYVFEFAVEVPVLDLPLFPPGIIDAASATYPERVLENVAVTAEVKDAAGSVIESVPFEAGEPEET